MVKGVYESGEGLFKVLPQNFPEKLGKTTRYFSQDSRFRNHDSNPSPLECSNIDFTRQNKFISLFDGVVSTSYRPYFVKKVTTQKIIFQERQEGGSILHLSNAKGGRISPTYLGYF
jgi:hypothetical protein